MKKTILAISALVFAAGAAFADPIEDREALMKSFGRSVGALAPVAKGEKPFDAAEVLAALTTLNEEAQKLDVEALFPEGSTNDKSTASPKIWEDKAGFQAAVDKYKADAAAAVAAAPGDLDAFKAEFGKVTSNCGTCHQAFRVKKG